MVIPKYYLKYQKDQSDQSDYLIIEVKDLRQRSVILIWDRKTEIGDSRVAFVNEKDFEIKKPFQSF